MIARSLNIWEGGQSCEEEKKVIFKSERDCKERLGREVRVLKK